MRHGIILAVLAAAFPSALFAATADEILASDGRYDTCIAATDENPEQAFEDAMVWRDQGGGDPAEHCIAMALLALGHAGEAAVRLDTLARETETGAPDERADLMAQSGEAWLLARRGDLAEATFSAALMLTPRDAEVWAARARARAMEEEWERSESDLDSAITFDNSNPEFFVLRAAARKARGRDLLAKEDIDRALRLDPDFPDALAERGLMRFAAGDENGARTDWIKVLNTAPDSAAADVARLGIERMEIRIEP